MKYNTLFIVLFLCVLPLTAEAQCAMCRAVLESEEGQKTAQGINNGIQYLMIIPYILVGIVAFILYRNNKNIGES